MPSHCIEIEGLGKRYNGAATDSLKDVNLSVLAGDKYGVLGPNGAGKTTLISILCGIFPATSGRFQYWDQDKKIDFKAVKAKIGFVPQEYALYEELTAIQNLEYYTIFLKKK